MIALFGKIVVVIGLVITIIGLIFGFGFMFQGDNNDLAKIFLMSIPFGFVILFFGLATVIMFSPRETELETTQKKESKNSVDIRS
jgi:uncharacterized membrane protein